ncbi:MAG: division/cell wall cluster transcriptional repressor MraZ [Bacteroidia bacterium]
MSELIGTYEGTVDAKGRAMLPSVFKKALQPVLEKGFVLKRSVFGTCLELYAMDDWKNVMKDVNKLNRFKRENMEFIRAFTAGLKSIEIDSTGRLLLPKDLLQFASISKDVVMTVTNNNVIEIWDKKKYDEAVNMPNDKFEALAERVMGSMGNKPEDDGIS